VAESSVDAIVLGRFLAPRNGVPLHSAHRMPGALAVAHERNGKDHGEGEIGDS
jgi:hypothetical protein